MPKYNSMSEVPTAVMDKLPNYFSNVEGDTFVIRNLPPELTGGLLARYSRAKTGMRLTLVNEFLGPNGEPSQELGADLMDRVLNAFGDESVGELEGAHVGVEQVSQLLTKHIEDRRIGGSPIEQSTRYVVYDQKDEAGRWRYLRPKELEGGDFATLRTQYEATNDRAFEVYAQSVGLLKTHFERVFPRSEYQIPVMRAGERVKVGESDLQGDAEKRTFRNSYAFTVRCAALDVGRATLPSSTLTHLGLAGNGRFYTKLITHLKSCGLMEGAERGQALQTELNGEIPTFVKRTREDERLAEIDVAMHGLAGKLLKGVSPTDESVILIPRADPLDEVVTACLFPYTNLSLQQIVGEVREMDGETKRDILLAYKGHRETRFDRSGRGLEAGYPYLFDLLGGFAEYRDLERHRMLTQQRQPLTTDLGFIMPPEMEIIGLENEVEEVVGMMEDLNSNMRHAGLDLAAQYATLFNNRIRFMMGMNLRELQHLSELRTQPAGHFSYRAMVMEMVKQVTARDPWTDIFLEFVDYSDPDNRITRAGEQQRIAGKNLATGVDGGTDLD